MKFLEIADEIGMVKHSKTGGMKNFNLVSLDDFFLNDSMSIDDLLTSADRQLIIKNALDTIKAKENERNILGSEQIQLYHGESIIEACINGEIIKNMYSLHDRDSIKKLGPDWYFRIGKQPLDRIREYFGESIGIYFAFAGNIFYLYFKTNYLSKNSKFYYSNNRKLHNRPSHTNTPRNTTIIFIY